MTENFESFEHQFKMRNSLTLLLSSNMTLFFQFCRKTYFKYRSFFVHLFENLYASVCVIFSKKNLEKI
jgi:hypothetical protein